MLTKRRIIVLAITGIMAAMITGGAVMAQDGGSQDGESTADSSTQSFADLVTDNLNQEEGVDLEVEVVERALADARMTMLSARYERKVQALRDLLNLDDEQLQALRDRFQSKLDDSAGASFGFRHGGMGHGMHGRSHFGGSFGSNHINPEATPSDTGGS